MSQSPIALTTPTVVNTLSAWIDVSSLDDDRHLIVGGATTDGIIVYGSYDGGTKSYPIPGLTFTALGTTQTQPIAFKDACTHMAIYRTAGTSAMVVTVGGANIAPPSPVAGPPTFGETSVQGHAVSSDATPFALATYTPPANGGYYFVGSYVTRKNSGSTHVSSGMISAPFRRAAGVVTIDGSGDLFGNRATAGFAPTLTIIESGGIVELHAVGIAATDITWQFYGAVNRA